MAEIELREANPWWADPGAIDADPAIVELGKSKFQRRLGMRYRFDAANHIYALRGPRRVGKTTLLMQEMRRLVAEEGVQPSDVLYYSFDAEGRPADIYDMVAEYLAMGGPHGRRFLFLDEVAGIKSWHKAIKKLIDRGRLEGCTVVAAGSWSADAASPVCQLYDRRIGPGGGLSDVVLEPMSFGEYVAARDSRVRSRLQDAALGDERSKTAAALSMLGGELPASVRDVAALVDELNRHFRSYLTTGGMPYVVNRLAAEKTVPAETYRRYIARTRSDLAAAGLVGNRVDGIAQSVAESVGSPVSWRSIGAGTDVESSRVVEEYVAKMSDMFLLRVVYRYNSSEDAPKRNTLKKVYFGDPFFYHAWGTRKRADPFARSIEALDDGRRAGPIVEQAVAGHAARLASALYRPADPAWRADALFYWKSRRGREVDFVVRTGEDAVAPIEVKWQGRVRRDDMYGMFDFRKATGANGSGNGAGGGVILSRDEAREHAGLAIAPAAVFALLA